MCKDSPETDIPLIPSSARRQRPLKNAHVNSLLLPLAGELRREKGAETYDLSAREPREPKDSKVQRKPVGRPPSDSTLASQERRASPRKTAPASHAQASLLHQRVVSEEDILFEDDPSDFVVDDSYSDFEALALESPPKKKGGLLRGPRSPAKPPPAELAVIDLTSPQKECPQTVRPVTPPPAPLNDSFGDNSPGRLRL